MSDKSLIVKISTEVLAFNFNLYTGAHTFDVEIVGTSSFDRESESWACDHIFMTGRLELQPSLFRRTWRSTLRWIRKTLKKYLRTDRPGAMILKKGQVVGVGFVSGDLYIIS